MSPRSLVHLALFSLGATPAAADPYPPGFTLRLESGGAAALAGVTTPLGDVALAGAAGIAKISLGAQLGNGIGLGATAATYLSFGPEFELAGMKLQGGRDEKWGVHLLGAEASYTVMPWDLRFGGSLGALVMTYQVADAMGDRTEVGIGGTLFIGKDWSVSPRWGLGVNVSLLVGRIPEEDTQGWGVLVPSLAVSATYR